MPLGIAGGRIRGTAGSGKGGIECAAAAAIAEAIVHYSRAELAFNTGLDVRKNGYPCWLMTGNDIACSWKMRD